MTIYHIEKPDTLISQILSASFPEYNGRKIKLSTDIPKTLENYWDGGSKSDYVFVQLSTMKAITVPTYHNMFEPKKAPEIDALPAGVVLVEHAIFCGKDSGITIHANAMDLAPLLPAGTSDLTDDEKIVLYCTRAYKSSYGGISNYRQHESGLSLDRWNAAKESCIAKGLLDKRGAITATGKNAAPNTKPRAS